MITPYENATGRRPALHALLRVRRPTRPRSRSSACAARRGAARRAGHARVPALGVAPRAAHHVRQLVLARRRTSCPRARAVSDFFDVVHAAARVPRSSPTATVDDATVATILDAGDARAERGEPSALGVRRRPRPGRRRRRSTTSPRRRGSPAGATFSAQRLDAKLLADVDAGVTGGGYRGAPVLVVVVRRPRARPRGDRLVVDLPGDAEPAARGDRARRSAPRSRPSRRRSPTSCARCSGSPTTSYPGRRPARPSGEGARPAAPGAVRRAHAPRALRHPLVGD